MTTRWTPAAGSNLPTRWNLQQERTDRPFQRIFPIPYVTGTPLRSDEMFVGRQDVFDFVREHLLGAYQNNVIVLHGQRRTGKTSILYRLQEVMADTHVAVLVDMQGKAARGTADFLYALSDDIVYALENHSIFVELPERREYEEAPEFTFRSRFLRAAVGQLDGRNLLLMFDEFEELQKRVEDGRLEPEIFPFLRYLMQHEPRLDFLFSGTHKLEELGAEYWSILFNIAAYKRITFLDDDEVRRLVAEPVAPYGLEYDPLAVDRIIQVTAGHPYFAQVVCHEMVAYHNETERSYLTVTCVDEVLEPHHRARRGPLQVHLGRRHPRRAAGHAGPHRPAARPRRRRQPGPDRRGAVPQGLRPVGGGADPRPGPPPGQGHPHPLRPAEPPLPLQDRPHPALDWDHAARDIEVKEAK